MLLPDNHKPYFVQVIKLPASLKNSLYIALLPDPLSTKKKGSRIPFGSRSLLMFLSFLLKVPDALLLVRRDADIGDRFFSAFLYHPIPGSQSG